VLAKYLYFIFILKALNNTFLTIQSIFYCSKRFKDKMANDFSFSTNGLNGSSSEKDPPDGGGVVEKLNMYHS